MGAFRFRLATLLRVRRLLEDQARLELAQLLKSQEENRQALAEAQGLRWQTLNNWHRPRQEGLTASDYQLFQQYIDYLQVKISDLLNLIRQKKIEIEVQQKKLTQLSQERQLLERLREKKWMAFKKEQNAQIQKEADEIALLRLNR